MSDELIKKEKIIPLVGHIDSNNAAAWEKKIMMELEGQTGTPVILDASTLKYISSAGLRILLRVRKKNPSLIIRDVSAEIFEILEMTGFTEIMTVEKAYRRVSIEGCEVIGEGANGKVYRLDRDKVVKVYKNADALSEIQHEREVARTALVLGIPTAISYDVVKVGDSYGSVFELLNASSFAGILAAEPQRFDWCVDEYVKMLKCIHGTVVPDGKLPRYETAFRHTAEATASLLPPAYGEKLLRMLDELPVCNTMIHGDCHTKNIVLANDEVLLIDMDTLSVGHPIFELAQMYNSYIGFGEYDPQIIARFQGYSAQTAREFWRRSLSSYLGTDDDAAVQAAEEKVRIVSYARLIDWGTRHLTSGSKTDECTKALWLDELLKLLDKVDTLDFDRALSPAEPGGELLIEADENNLPKVQDFVEQRLEAFSCPLKAMMNISLAVEEIFVNIAHYAYAPDKGNATVRVDVSGDPVVVTITFIDHGVPYDPLKKEDPDITQAVNERPIGGLGIFLAKKTMDDISYEYKDGRNILTLMKKL